MHNDAKQANSPKSVEDAIAAMEAVTTPPAQASTSHKAQSQSATNATVLDIVTANLKDGVALLDENMRYLFISDSVYAQTGFTKDQIGPGDSLETMHSMMIASGLLDPKTIDDPRLRRGNNKLLTGTENGTVFKMATGQYFKLTRKILPNGWTLSHSEDITHIIEHDKILEEALRLGRAGYWVYDFETKTYELSKSFTNFLGKAAVDDLHKGGIVCLSHPDDRERFRRALRNISRTGDKFRITTRLAHYDTTWLETNAQLIRNADGTPSKIRGFGRDVTKNLSREKALENAKDAAIAATHAKSDFLASMSHEIRTPMNGVLGMAELLGRTDLNTKQKDYLKVINSSSHSLLTIINDILDLSKIEAGAMTLDPMPFNLRESIDDVMALLSVKAREKGLDLIVDYPAELPRNFTSDAGRLRQVLTNLIGNAIKFTASGQVTLTVAVNQQNDDRAALTLSVKDTGIGIAPAKLDSIFEKFSQGGGKTHRQYGGTGLGLTISRHIISLMGGEMRATSILGDGSVFSVNVDMPKVAAQTQGPARILSGLKVIIIDDTEITRNVLQNRLNHWGAQCDVTDSAAGGISKMMSAANAGRPYDMVICDYVMPDVSGPDFAKVMSRNDLITGTPVIMISSQETDMKAQDLKDIGVTAFLMKPVRESRLLETLSKTLYALSEKTPKAPTKAKAHEDPETTPRDLISDAEATLSDIRSALAGMPVPAQAYAEESQAEAEPEVSTPEKPKPEKCRILVAEDFPLNQDVVRLMLSESRYVPEFAANGKIAVDLYAQNPHKYEAILMDVSMPVMDGFEASELIRARQVQMQLPHIPIIALTGHALKNDKDKCMDTGMDDYMTKPVKQLLLLETLDKWTAKTAAGHAQNTALSA